MTLEEFIRFMPPFQAAANTIAIVLLCAGYHFIRTGNRGIHRNCMVAALLVSTATVVPSMGWVNDGQPVPDSNFSVASNSRVSQQAQA